MVGQAIKRFEQDLIVRKLTGTKKIKGKFRDIFASDETIKGTALPGKGKDIAVGLFIEVDGARIAADYKFYFEGDPSVPLRSIITFQNDEYKIVKTIDRVFHGNYITLLGMRRRK